MHVSQPYIAIEGVIGVGKTTLVRLLQPRFGGSNILEAFDENPFLSDFYEDRARYAFQTQLFFLLSRYRQQQLVPGRLGQGALLADYTFEKDRLFAHLNITSGDELRMYERLYETLSEHVRAPDLIVYLRAEIDTLMARIAMRDRTYERQMDRGYISALRQEYEHWLKDYEASPLLVIDTDELDFVRHPTDLDDVEMRIRTALAGVHQPLLPELAAAKAPHLSWQLTPEIGAPVVSAAASEAHQRANAHAVTNWHALGDFLALAEAVGHVGGVLAQQAPVGPAGPPAAVREALQRAYRALAALMQRTGVSLVE